MINFLFILIKEGTRKKSQKIIASKNITLMVITSSFLNFFGTVPYLVYYILNILLDGSCMLDTLKYISESIIMIEHSAKIFIYFFFNKLFRQILIKIFRGKK